MTRIHVAALLLLACTVHSTKLVGLYSVWLGNDNYNRSFAFIDTASQTSSMINWGIDDWGEGSGVVSTVVQDPQQGPVLYWVRSKIRDNVASSMLYAQPLSASKPVTTPLVMYPNSTSSIQVDPKRPGYLFMNQFVEFGSPLQLTYFNPSTRTWANTCQAPFSFAGALDYDRRLWVGGTNFQGLADASVTDMNNCASYDISLTCVSNPADFQLDRITYDGRLKKFIILAWDSTGLFGFALDSGNWRCNTLFSILEVETAPWWNEAYNPATSKAVGVLRQDVSKQASVLTVYDLAANRTAEVVKGPMISGLDFWQLTSLAFVDQGL